MKYIVIGLILYVSIILTYCIANKKSFRLKDVLLGALTIVIGFIVVIKTDEKIKTNAKEIRSGVIESVKHEEEWEEWHPPVTDIITETDSKGNVVTRTIEKPGYWEHHKATNYIKTTDSGTKSIYKVPDGRILNDNFVNTTEELEKYYPIGSPTASIHTYKDKVRGSYSLFKSNDIDLKEYPDLFKYPDKENEYLSVNRLLGEFNNKEEYSRHLDSINSKLNDTNNPNNKDNVKSYKQVNLIIVNFGDKGEEYGYALQDYWRNGAKNDIVVTFGTDKKGKPIWSYVFSWSEVELLKTNIRERILEVEDINKEFKDTLEDISDIIESKFERKEFSDFNYIEVKLSVFAKLMLIIVFIVAICILFKYK